jgi:hypothetical protein
VEHWRTVIINILSRSPLYGVSFVSRLDRPDRQLPDQLGLNRSLCQSPAPWRLLSQMIGVSHTPLSQGFRRPLPYGAPAKF